MNKAELVNAISAKYGHTKKEATQQLDQILDVILHSIPKDGSVKIRGFGTFNVVERKEKIFTNPRTKKRTHISKRNVVVFIPSSKMEELVRIDGDTHD